MIKIDSYISAEQVARYFDVSNSTVRNWERRGWLAPDHRTGGGHRRYKVSDVQLMVERWEKMEKKVIL